MSIPENIHTSHIMQTADYIHIFRNIYVYTYTYMYVTIIRSHEFETQQERIYGMVERDTREMGNDVTTFLITI